MVPCFRCFYFRQDCSDGLCFLEDSGLFVQMFENEFFSSHSRKKMELRLLVRGNSKNMVVCMNEGDFGVMIDPDVF